MIKNLIKRILKKPYIKFRNWKDEKKYNQKYESKVLLDKKYTVIRGSIRGNDDYDDAWLLYLSNKCQIVFDIGCNIGQSSILISHSKLLKKLFLVEPNPLSLSMASENLILNNLSDNVTFIPKAAYNKSNETIRLWTMPGAYAGASIDINFSESGKITNNFFEVETITLDDIAKTHNYNPDLVKIDVEGAEYSVLEGATNIAKSGHTIFLVEVHSSPDLSIEENTSKILNWTENNNYQAYYLSKHTHLKNLEDIKGRGRYHLLLIHKEKEYPEGLNKIKQAAKIEELNLN